MVHLCHEWPISSYLHCCVRLYLTWQTQNNVNSLHCSGLTTKVRRVGLPPLTGDTTSLYVLQHYYSGHKASQSIVLVTTPTWMCNIEDHISKEVNSNGKSFVLIFNYYILSLIFLILLVTCWTRNCFLLTWLVWVMRVRGSRSWSVESTPRKLTLTGDTDTALIIISAHLCSSPHNTQMEEMTRT